MVDTAAAGRIDRVRHRVVQEALAPACRRRRRASPRTAGAGRAIGVLSSRAVTSGRKPMSAIWSASSSTVISMSSSEHSPFSIRSPRRPGVATRMSTPRRRSRICLSYGLPPNAVRLNRPSDRASGVIDVVDLHGELTRRHQDQRLRVAGAALPPSRDADQDRQAERERLAGAGLATAEHVAAGERVRDGRGLDREWRGDAPRVQGSTRRRGTPRSAKVISGATSSSAMSASADVAAVVSAGSAGSAGSAATSVAGCSVAADSVATGSMARLSAADATGARSTLPTGSVGVSVKRDGNESASANGSRAGLSVIKVRLPFGAVRSSGRFFANMDGRVLSAILKNRKHHDQQ